MFVRWAVWLFIILLSLCAQDVFAADGYVPRLDEARIGATNVLRTGRRGLAATTLLCDTLKGTLAVLLTAHYAGAEAALWAGAGAFLGHLFPIWLKFKGGKGVATYIGVLLGLYWLGAVIFCAIWLSVAAIGRYSSLAALIASALTPPTLWLLGQPSIAVLMLTMTTLLWIKHQANIRRLLAGTEGRIGKPSL